MVDPAPTATESDSEPLMLVVAEEFKASAGLTLVAFEELF